MIKWTRSDDSQASLCGCLWRMAWKLVTFTSTAGRTGGTASAESSVCKTCRKAKYPSLVQTFMASKIKIKHILYIILFLRFSHNLFSSKVKVSNP